MSAITVGVTSCIIVLGAGVVYAFSTNDWNHIITFTEMSIKVGAIATIIALVLEH